MVRDTPSESERANSSVIANMFFIPTAIFYGAPGITVSFYIWKSLIPTLLGNIVGGGIMVALPYWYLYLFQEETTIEFDTGGMGTAVNENAGPTSNSHSRRILHGREVHHSDPALQLPQPGADIRSGVSRELSEEKYGKKPDGQTNGISNGV
jgi:Formate/nitrite transporter